MIKPISIRKYRMLYIATAKQKVLELLYKFPDKEFSVSDIAKEAKVAKANLSDILEELNNIGFIQIEKLTKIWRIKANQTNWYYVKSKIVYNLNFIYQSGLVESLSQYYKNPKAIILFGSFRKGEDNTDSDIDIAIEREDINEYKIASLRELAEFEHEIGKRIHLHEFNRKSIELHLFNNIANGIVLLGFLEVKP